MVNIYSPDKLVLLFYKFLFIIDIFKISINLKNKGKFLKMVYDIF